MKLFSTGLVLLIVLIGCGEKKQANLKPNDDRMPIAVVDDDTLRLGDFKNFIKQSEYKKLDVSDDLQRKKALDNLIQETLIAKYAAAEKLNDNAAVKQKIRDEREELLYKKVVRLNIYYPIIPETMVLNYYERLKNQWHLKQIFIGHTEIRAQMNLQQATKYSRSREKAKKIADSLYQALVANSDKFDSFAAEFSNDEESNIAGGDLGFVRFDAIDLAFQEVIAGLAIDEVSKPVEGTSGYHIFKLVGKSEAKDIKPLDELRNGIKDRVIFSFEKSHRKEITERLNVFSDSLLSAYNFAVEKSSVDLFLKKYQSTRGPEEVVNIFSNDERALKLATYRDGSIVIDELIEVMQDNKKKINLNVPIMSEGLKKIAATRVFAAYAPHQGLSLTAEEEAFVGAFQRERMIDLAKKINIDEKINYDDNRLKNHYETNSAHFRTLNVLTLSMIRTQDAEMIKKYQSAIQAGEPFEAVAEKASKDSGTVCEKIGPVQDDKKNEWVSYAAQLEVGKVSDPITSDQGGYAIVKLLEKDEGRILPYERVSDLVRADYQASESKKLYREWLDNLKIMFPVQLFEKNFNDAYNVTIK